ncbi:MAG: amylo-alpha-1,6-glucosidase [Prevotellaceae bacterium]|nr:amylo-alpha-1,6-glucosidase [Prevotellaceae bacterium]
MGYLHFEKALMTNLQESLRKELLRVSRSGAYASSTLVDCNTRKYHGLLVVPIPELDRENHVLLSSLDVSVIQHGAQFNLGLHKYQGHNFSPLGHKYIREFNADTVPTTIYRVGGVLLKKELLFQKFEDRILLRYTLLDSTGAATLRFQPFLAFRSVREYTRENSTASRDYQVVDNGIKTCMYAGYPDLYMQFSRKNTFVFHPDWYRGVEYPKEQERGYETKEDLYVPGYFELSLKKGESVVFAASTSEFDSKKLRKLFDAEVETVLPWDNFYHCLASAAHQFHYNTESGSYIIAGHPWFKCRARDEFISLPGLTLSIKEPHHFEDIMKTAAKGIREFMAGKKLTIHLQEIEHPDVLLWAVWALQQYANDQGYAKCKRKYGKLVADIMDYLLAGKHPNFRIDANGLAYCEGNEKAVTWMNSTANGRPITPRSGYIVEINALWYNALCFAAALIKDEAKPQKTKAYEEAAIKVKESFAPTFLNEYGYHYDYVDGNMMEWSVRPNMILAAAFEFTPLDAEARKSVVDICTRELLTPKGLRSLSPKSGGYNPNYVGPQYQRDYAYHQGTAWPWLESFYLEACIKVYKRSRLSFIQRQMIGFEEEIAFHAIGTMPELFDGNPPFSGRGAYAFAMNVAELLRISEIIQKYK